MATDVHGALMQLIPASTKSPLKPQSAYSTAIQVSLTYSAAHTLYIYLCVSPVSTILTSILLLEKTEYVCLLEMNTQGEGGLSKRPTAWLTDCII